MSDPAVISASSDDDDNNAIPHVAIAFFAAQDDEVDLTVHILKEPDPIKLASAALLTGLAVLALDRQGYIEKAVERMFPNGRPTEKEATDHITLLMQQDANAKPV